MKKWIALFVLAIPVKGISQTYFTALNFPIVGYVVTKFNCDTTGVASPVAGHGQTWSYGSLTSTSSTVTTYTDSLWCTGMFPTSAVQAQFNNTDWFYKKETDTLRFLGNCLSDSSSASTFNAFYDKPAIELFTNMNYGQVYHDSAHFQYGTGEFRNQATTFEVIADGTLTTPLTTYTNVHVLKKEVYIREPGTNDEKEHYLYYYFYDSLISQPVFEISFLSVFGNPLGFKKVKYSDVSNGITENAAFSRQNIYPNPFMDRFFVEGFWDKDIQVYDIHFNPVGFTKELTSNGFYIRFDVWNLLHEPNPHSWSSQPHRSPKLYFVVITDHGYRSVHKVIRTTLD
ncbi:MAG TPA: hypothetical protein VK177_07795 [Flavobacteriales bacterium]|nr:hypothetical protein [Flavobacteriales bacterium]